MKNIELQELLKQYPDNHEIMISDPCENAYEAAHVFEGNCYMTEELEDEEENVIEENDIEVPAIYIQAKWEH